MPEQLSPQFKSTEEELQYLRSRIAEQEGILAATKTMEQSAGNIEASRQSIAQEMVKAYTKMEPDKIIHNDHQMSHQEVAAISLNLSPEAHDAQIEGLYALMLERGVHNALRIVENMNNPHLTDDFHRFLVQYLVATGAIPKLDKASDLHKQLDATLYEITLPNPEEDKPPNFKEMVAIMSQMLYGLQSIGTTADKSKHWYTLEMAVPTNSTHASFYVTVPNHACDLFEKQLFALYTEAQAKKLSDDFNIFSDTGVILAAYAKPKYSEMTSFKTYDEFEADPIDVLVQTFSKLSEDGEGAILQLVVVPNDDGKTGKYTKVLEQLKKGIRFYKLNKKPNIFTKMVRFFEPLKAEENRTYKHDDTIAEQQVEKKLKSPLVQVCMRLAVSSQSLEKATQLMHEIKSGFQQFRVERAGEIAWSDIHPGNMRDFIHDLTYRAANPDQTYIMSLIELASLYHFPAVTEKSSHLKRSRAQTAPAPFEVPKEGIILGTNEHRGASTVIHMTAEDRMRHMYVIGQTGTGKTGILVSMIAQDIANGSGVCFIDPHGDDVQKIMGMIPEHRIKDVIYFDPTYMPRTMGLNVLEFDPRFPQQKSLIVDSLMSIFSTMFDLKMTGGPQFEQYFKNATYLIMEHPESGCTLMEIARVMSDAEYRNMKLSHCKNPLIIQFWESATKTKGEQGLDNYVPYITSKFDPFLSNEFMRPIVAQEHSAFNVRDIMDNKKILLLNLSKGMLGEMNAKLLGMLLVGKLQMAAMSRADSYGQKKEDFFLYIDEFQNFITPAISSILSEARKYRLSLNIAHQNLAQLTDPVLKGAIFGNIGTKVIFRVSPEDAAELEISVKPFHKEDIIKLEFRNAYLAMLANGKPILSFNIMTPDNPPMDMSRTDLIKQYSYMTYCRDRAEVEAEIITKFRAGKPEPEAIAPPALPAAPATPTGSLADLF